LLWHVRSTDVRIALVGKYTDLHDTYLSVVKALLHAALAHRQRLHVEWIDSSALEAGPGGSAESAAAWEQVSASPLQCMHGLAVKAAVHFMC
jgi:CTP synthase